MHVYKMDFSLHSEGFSDIIDVTSTLQSELKKSGIKDGVLNVFVPGSTAGITTIEYEPGAFRRNKMLWLYFQQFFLSIFSVFIWVINAEGYLLYNLLSTEKTSPFMLALAASLGQSLGFSLIFFFSESFLRLFPKVQKKVDQFDLVRFRKSSSFMLFSGSLVGVPPLSVLGIVSAGVGIRFEKFLIIAFIGRISRFLLIAFFPRFFMDFFQL